MILKFVAFCFLLQLVLGRTTPNAIRAGSECQDIGTEIRYPAARRDKSVIDDYHGTKVISPL